MQRIFGKMLLLTLLVYFGRFAPAQEVAQAGCCSVVDNALRAAGQLKAGMTRLDVERAFTKDGGLSFGSEDVYVLKECHNIKIRLKFIQVRGNGPEDESRDVIQAVSTPFLAYEVTD